jgi:hypothetical protein
MPAGACFTPAGTKAGHYPRERPSAVMAPTLTLYERAKLSWLCELAANIEMNLRDPCRPGSNGVGRHPVHQRQNPARAQSDRPATCSTRHRPNDGPATRKATLQATRQATRQATAPSEAPSDAPSDSAQRRAKRQPSDSPATAPSDSAQATAPVHLAPCAEISPAEGDQIVSHSVPIYSMHTTAQIQRASQPRRSIAELDAYRVDLQMAGAGNGTAL